MSKYKHRKLIIRVVSNSFLGIMLIIGGTWSPVAHADQFDQQIQALQQQNDQNLVTISQLEEQAGSYQDAISRLESQIAQIQQQIIDSEGKRIDLQQQIQVAENEMADQRHIVGEIVRQSYLDGQPSTLEMLASSKDLSNFFDKETYRASVQRKIQTTLNTITNLRVKLQEQKNQFDQLLLTQKSQQAQLDANKSQQAQLLAYNQSQQTSYDQQMQGNQTKIVALRSQQAALISRYQIGGTLAGDTSHGGYPVTWNNSPQDSLIDSWGMFNRECVSYTAFKVHQDYLAGKDKHDMPYWGGIGDARNWPANARSAGIPVDTNPTPGSIAISAAGTWGHSMYVEAVGTQNGRQAVYVSQYNADFSGHYSEGWRYTNGLYFIHF